MLEAYEIRPDAVFDGSTLYQQIGLSSATLARARRSGVLRFTRQGTRILYRGSWLLAWLEETAKTPLADAGRKGAN